MDKKCSRWCSVIPSMQWWLLTLLGLPLLYFLMINDRQDMIENDLTTRTTEGLQAAGLDWAKVNLKQRGRDLQLQGMAASEAERDEAITLARGVTGVREVEDLVDVSQPVPPEFMLQSADGKVVLEGTLASQEEIDTLASAAEKIYGSGRVDNRLQTGERVSTAEWMDGLQESLLPAMQRMDNGSLQISAEGRTITGQVSSADAKSELLDKAGSILGAQFDEQIVVQAAPPPEPEPKPEPAQEAAPEEAEPAPEQIAAKQAAAEAKAAGEKAAAEQAAEAKAVQNCQQQLNDAMSGKTILFATDKADIQRDSSALLDSLVGIVSGCQNVVAARGIKISGHTDSVGQDTYNQVLSQRRADAVRDYFVKSGIESSIITTAGYGESQPVASNDTAEGRAQNRRITFEINPE